MSTGASRVDLNSRRMIFPTSIAAKLRNFPWKFYYTHQPYYKYLFLSALVCAPLFYKIQKLTYSPQNVKKWEEIRKKEIEEALSHQRPHHH